MWAIAVWQISKINAQNCVVYFMIDLEEMKELQLHKDFNWVTDILMKHDEDKTALMLMDQDENIQNVTYGELVRKSMQYANLLWDEGIHKGDAILIMTKMIPDLWYVAIASALVGVVYSPAPLLLTSGDIKYRVEQINAKAVFTDSDSRKSIENATRGYFLKIFDVTSEEFQNRVDVKPSEYSPIHRDPETPHAIFFTSGTEGKPKAIVHNGYYPLGHLSTALWLGIGPKDIHWNISSPGWAKWAWSNLYAPLVAGSTSFAYEQGRFSAERSLSVLENYPITSLCTAPTVWRMFLVQKLDSFRPLALKKCSSAGEPLNPEIISRWEKITGVTIRDGYGQSESTAMIGNIDPNRIKPGSAGKPLLQYDLRIVDEDGNELGPGEEGNIAVRIDNRVPGLFDRYGNDSALNADRFKHGFYYTGDLGKIDSDGYIWFVSRADDVIKASDYRIGPFEVESALMSHPAVAESAVVPTPDEIRGNLVKAFVILRPGFKPSSDLARELSLHVKSVTAPYMRPKKIEFVSELPKTISGKIIRKQLRNLEMERYAAKKDAEEGTLGGREYRIP
jgi:acyl-coenzyme A synthetase/AMP-(fatty) acid ligase